MVNVTRLPALVESWYFCEEMASRREYGEIVTSNGEISLSPELEVLAGFCIEQLQGSRSVIDVGSGLGFPSLVLASRVGRLVALDASPTMTTRLQAHVRRLGYHARMSAVLAGASALPLRDEQFDGASLSGILGSLAEPSKFLEELHRVMQVGGVAACIVQDFSCRLQLGEPRTSHWFRMDEGKLSYRVVENLCRPYRIRESCYMIRHDSELYQGLVAERPAPATWRIPTDLGLAGLPPGAVAAAVYNEAIQYDADSLLQAFEQARFRRRQVEFHHVFGRRHVFGTFERQ